MLRAHKGDSYARELHDARMRGAWDPVPAGAKPGKEHFPHGSLPEIIRKFLKHNAGSSATADVASAEYELRAFLGAYWADAGWTVRSHSADFARPGRVGLTAFPPSVPATGAGPGWSADIYAGIVSRLQGLQKRAYNDTQQASLTAVLAYALLCAGRDEEAVMLIHEARFIESLQIDSLRSPGHSDDYEVALLILGFAVYGMANERLHHSDPSAGYAPFAFAGYARAIDLFDGVRGKQKATTIDEIERWGELALYRNALFSVRESETLLGLNALRAYQTHASRWAPTFRPTQRAVIYRTYLEVLNRSVVQRSYTPPPLTPEPGQHDPRSQIYQTKVIQTVAARVPIMDSAETQAKRGAHSSVRPGSTARTVVSRTTSSRRPHRSSTIRPGSLLWNDETYTIARAVSAVIARSSEFPHAGQTNLLALELADALMTSWKLNGQEGGFVADDLVQSLYAMTHITFDSHLISRSLMEALTVAEQYDEAEQALKLYVQLVEKTREAVEAEKKNARKAEGEEDDHQSQASAASINKFDDNDDAETYTRTLIYGSRLLSVYLGKHAEADKVARRALEILETDEELEQPPEDADEEDKGRYNELAAFLKRGAGVVRSALASAQTEPARRESMHKEALALLTASAKQDNEAAETFYNLAHLQAQLHDIPAATSSARKAVELEPAAIEPWHLLALLLSAKKDYKAALRLASVALDEAEADSKHDQDVMNQEAAMAKSAEQHEALDSIELRTELLSYDFPPAHTEREEAVLQLLITHNVLEELVSGTAVAIDGQKEIFVYFHNHVASDATERLGSTVKGPLPQHALSDEALHIDTHPPGYFHRRGSRLTSLLHNGPHKLHSHLHGHSEHPTQEDGNDEAGAYSTVSGLGQTGVEAAPNSTVVIGTGEVGSAVAAPPPVAADPAAVAARRREAGYTSYTIHRLERRSQSEANLLARLWLMSAATFRRAGQLADCRVAIQEAERTVPDFAGVWTQLGLYHAENDRLTAATNSLYKAIACEPGSVAAAVHLSRLLLSYPEEMPAASANASPSGQVGILAMSRSIAVPLKQNGSARPVDVQDQAADQAESKDSLSADPSERRNTARPTSLSLAEALLSAATAGPGWDAPEAWLYLGHVANKTNRPDQAVESLKYALWLEQSKPVRPLSEALAFTLS